MATNRFLCEICGKGFQRDQNLQLHRRGHNLPWKLKQRSSKEPKKRVYVCPEKTCVHHHPSRALGDLTGIKKHFCRKHGEKKWKCEKCSKRYAVQSDWKAHSKTCGAREYKCDCGTLFSRRDSFITHRAFCDALAEETARVKAASDMNIINPIMGAAAAGNLAYHFISGPNNNFNNMTQHFPSVFKPIISSSSSASPNDNHHHEAARSQQLSLWMSDQHDQTLLISSPNNNSDALFHDHHQIRHHHHQHQHQLGNSSTVSSASEIFGTSTTTDNNPLVSCTTSSSNLPPPSEYHHQQQQQQLNWVFGSGGGGSSAQLVTVPSLYSNQLSTPSAAANMSATALLQKAAQIGATSSVDSSFLGSFGLKCNNNSNSSTITTQLQDGNNINKLCDNPEGEIFQIYPPAAKRRNIAQQVIEARNALNRIEMNDQIQAEALGVARTNLNEALLREETFWKQKSRVAWLKDGDKCTKFFMASTVIRRRKNFIQTLKADNGEWVSKMSEIAEMFISKFRNTFSRNPTTSVPEFGLVHNVQITDCDNMKLIVIPHEKEIEDCLRSMGHGKAPGPDGMPTGFYLQHWQTIDQE
uniref:C2H2-type domain-containing protein n=1 Tax=Cannabis sativa TaxID=3483 RepID=A0A803QJL7_CANSA